MDSTHDNPRFIFEQRLLLLTDVAFAREHLRALNRRQQGSGRGGGEMSGEVDDGVWRAVSRERVADGRVKGFSLRRAVVATDAGIGKTELLRFLSWRINRDGVAAFVLNVADLPANPDDLLAVDNPASLVQRFCNEVAEYLEKLSKDNVAKRKGDDKRVPTLEEARALLLRLRDRGDITLLLDALDQGEAGDAHVRRLANLLANAGWRRCRFIVSGRLNAIETHWDDLLGEARGWAFLRPAEFTEEQQRQYLGPERWERIQKSEAREILAVPRVLYYLRKVTGRELQNIRTASDVYCHATGNMLGDAMEKRFPGLKPRLVQMFLAAIAFEMVADPEGPNFDGVPKEKMADFVKRVAKRCGTYHHKYDDPDRIEEELKTLAAMNTFLHYGLLEHDCPDSIHWRNKSLLEFFAAYWLAMHCSEEDAARLWDWLYRPEDPASDAYYWMWRFLAEMPSDARDPTAWVRAVEPIFRPGDGTERTKRGGELIYRAWPRLEEHAANSEDARKVRDNYLGEFERILHSKPGDEHWRGENVRCAAQELRDSFQHIPGGKFTMGSPPEKGGIPEHVKEYWLPWIEKMQTEPERQMEEIEKRVAGFRIGPGRYGKQQASATRRFLCRLAREGLQALATSYDRSDEKPTDREVAAFRLCRYSTLNGWYRLYDPAHGLEESNYRVEYCRISGETRTPAIYVSWYDAWAFCLWAFWSGQSCRLPQEDEWEYACKAGTVWAWDYWWGDEFDKTKCNAARRVNRATSPTPAHANPWKLFDMLGNVWEWCDNWYAADATEALDNPNVVFSARVLRGGSWVSYPHFARLTARRDEPPTVSNHDVGFRVARSLPAAGRRRGIS